MLIKFRAKLGPNLATTLKHALVRKDLTLVDTKEEALFSLIHDALVPCLEGHDKLLLKMERHCGENGPASVKWLMSELDASSTATRNTLLFLSEWGQEVRA